jgi:hypothetical protein
LGNERQRLITRHRPQRTAPAAEKHAWRYANFPTEYPKIRDRIEVTIFIITIAIIWVYPISMVLLLILAAAISPRVRQMIKFYLTGD